MTAQTGTLYWLGVLLPDAELDPTEKLLMIGLADHVDADDECFVGIDTLATYARVSYGTARRRLAQLADKGRLDRARRRRSDGNLSTYSWRLVRPAPILRDDQRAPGRAVTSAHQGARAEVPSDGPPSGEQTHVSETPTTVLLVAGFDRFWKAYPRSTAKGQARAAWPAAVKAAGGIDKIVAGAERYRDDPNRADQFTAHAATWLRGERWDDEPLPPRAARPNATKVAAMDTDRDAPAGRLYL